MAQEIEMGKEYQKHFKFRRAPSAAKIPASIDTSSVSSSVLNSQTLNKVTLMMLGDHESLFLNRGKNVRIENKRKRKSVANIIPKFIDNKRPYWKKNCQHLSGVQFCWLR